MHAVGRDHDRRLERPAIARRQLARMRVHEARTMSTPLDQLGAGFNRQLHQQRIELVRGES